MRYAALAPVLLLVCISKVFALDASKRSLDIRDPLPLPFPAALKTDDFYFGWEDELHFDRSDITLTDGTRRVRSPSHGNSSFVAGFRFTDDFSFQLQTILAYQNQGFTGQGQLLLMDQSEIGIDLSFSAFLGWSRNGGLLSGGGFVLGRTFRSKSGKGVTFSPQLILGVRELGHDFSVAAAEGDPNSPFGEARQKRLVFDSLLFLEAEFKGFVGRFGGGWESLLQTHYTHEQTPGAAYSYSNSALLFVSFGASFSFDDL